MRRRQVPVFQDRASPSERAGATTLHHQVPVFRERASPSEGAGATIQRRQLPVFRERASHSAWVCRMSAFSTYQRSDGPFTVTISVVRTVVP